MLKQIRDLLGLPDKPVQNLITVMFSHITSKLGYDPTYTGHKANPLRRPRLSRQTQHNAVSTRNSFRRAKGTPVKAHGPGNLGTHNITYTHIVPRSIYACSASVPGGLRRARARAAALLQKAA